MLKPLRLTQCSRSITSQSKIVTRDPLVIQGLRLRSPDTGCQGLVPGQGTRSHMLQLRPGTAKFYKHLNRFFLKAHMAGVKGVREREAYLLRGSRGIRQQQSLYWVSVHSQGT